MSVPEHFSGFTFEQICQFVISLDAISSPTDADSYMEAADIILASIPDDLSDPQKQAVFEHVNSLREKLTAQVANFDYIMSSKRVEERIKVKTGTNVRTNGLAGTFREGLGDAEGARIQITFNPDPQTYSTQEVMETLIHEYVHASGFLRSEDNADDSTQFGKRCLNAFWEWNQKCAQITGLEKDDPRLAEIRVDMFGHGHVYEGDIGKISSKIVEYKNHDEIQKRKQLAAQDPYLLERKKAYPKGVPTLHKGMPGAYRSNDQRYYCEKDGSEWRLSDENSPGAETHFTTLGEAKLYVEENYMREWRDLQADKPDLSEPDLSKPELERQETMLVADKPELETSHVADDMDGAALDVLELERRDNQMQKLEQWLENQ